MSDSLVLERVEPGLDSAAKLQPGKGWVAADVQASSDTPLSVSVEAGLKLSPDWSAYGDVWVRPTGGTFGGDVAARFKDSVDIFAGAAADTSGNWNAQAGMKWRF